MRSSQRYLPWVITVAIVIATPFASLSIQYFLMNVMIWGIFAIGFNLVFGVAGLMSLGHAAFYGMGAYAVALLPQLFSMPPLMAFLCGIAISAVMALLMGLISLRLSGLFLGLTTLAVAQLIEFIIRVRFSTITNGEEGIINIARPSVMGWTLESNSAFAVFVAVIFLAALLLSVLLKSSPWGVALKAMRDNHMRASQLGFAVRRLKLSVFAVSGAFAGLAGGLLAMLMRFTNSEQLHWSVSGDVLITVLLGGAGTLFGPASGALVFGFMHQYLGSITDRWHGLLGLILILITLFMPGGLAEFGYRCSRLWSRAK